MSRYNPRLTKDGIWQNPYYYADNPYHREGNGMPNCTAYAWGRACELMGKIVNNLPLGNAGDWYTKALQAGIYQVSTTGPKLGAIACYGHPGYAGHVAIVEEIHADGSFTISQSGYKRPVSSYPPDMKSYFWTDVCDAQTGTAPWMGTAYYLQGFIYIPWVGGGDIPTPSAWIKGNRYLNAEEMRNNARIVWDTLRSWGWTENAVAAVLGNMQGESRINPGIWESLTVDYKRGFGLVQWTPATKLFNWITQYHPGTPNDDGDVQLARIKYELDNGIQWDTTNGSYPDVRPPYNMTFREFTKSTKDVRTLTGAWMLCYEKPADQSENKVDFRAGLAQDWYNLFHGTSGLGLPAWMLFCFGK